MKNKKILALIMAIIMVIGLVPATSAVAADADLEVVASRQNIIANGETVETEVYNINGNNYFKLRDVAALMKDTDSQFSVEYDEDSRTVDVTTGADYFVWGSELKPGEDKSSTCVASSQKLIVNGVEMDYAVYNIGGNNYFKLRDLGVALGIRVDYDKETNAAIMTSGGYSLVLDADAYTMHEETVGDIVLKYRAYEKVVYESNPVVAERAVMTIYVPEAYFNGESINGYTADTAPIFLKNNIGGYMQADIKGLTQTKNGVTSLSAEGQMLSHGLVVASAAARGHNTLDPNDADVSLGLAPAGVVDMKAAISYLRFNDELIPGSAERIISDGGSAGGAISALLGTSGNDPLYKEYLDEVGAANEPNDIFAAFVFCPILDMENLNSAYEWFYMGTGLDWYAGKSTWSKNDEGHVEMSEVEKVLSPIFADVYIDYINDWNLVSPIDDSPLTLDEDGEGSYREFVKATLLASAQECYDEKGKLTDSKFPGCAESFVIEDGKVVDCDVNAYLTAIMRLTGVGAMDNGYCLKNQYGEDMGLVQTNEAKLFAINGYSTMVHFDKNLYPSMVKAVENGADFGYLADYGLTLEDFKVTEGLDPDSQESPVYLMNPMNFVGDADSDTAPNFFVCAGACDNDVSMITATLLGTALYSAGDVAKENLVIEYEWDQKHGGDYDYAEMFAWIDEICDPLRFDSMAGEARTLAYGDAEIAYTAYEGISYCTAPVLPANQTLNVYIPETASEDSPILYINGSGGYNAATASDVAASNATAQRALSEGYVVVSGGLRGQKSTVDNGDGTKTHVGRAPASVVDLKAGVRYLKYNDAIMLGDADKIIMAGSSSGGGTTALVGVTGNSEEYAPYLEEIGAADATDDIYAAVCYCPVFDLKTSDISYAWQVQGLTESLGTAESVARSYINGSNLGLFHNERNGYTVNEEGVYVLSDEELVLSEYFVGLYPEIMNEILVQIGLEELSVNEDGKTGTFVDFMLETISAEYNRYMTENWDAETIKAFINGTGVTELVAAEANADKGTFDVDRSAWLAYDEETGTVAVTDLWGFYAYVGLLKSAPAFDGKRETNVFGPVDYAADEKTDEPFDVWLAEYRGETISEESQYQQHLFSVFDHVNNDETDNAEKWFIRYGTIDNGIHAYPTLLAESLEAQGTDVNFRMAFERTHSGFYELDDLFGWIEANID